jgi:hypothetical protein
MDRLAQLADSSGRRLIAQKNAVIEYGAEHAAEEWADPINAVV